MGRIPQSLPRYANQSRVTKSLKMTHRSKQRRCQKARSTTPSTTCKRSDSGKQWAAEDKKVREKLAALEKKFGKKPNIVYILADDIGYTELGCYGGGIRGFTTPNLDKMARAGMRFKSYYSQPACTTTRIALMTGRIPVRNGLSAVLIMPWNQRS